MALPRGSNRAEIGTVRKARQPAKPRQRHGCRKRARPALTCGPALAGDAISLDDPLIVVEVLSPSSRARDSGAKLADYFRLPSLRHYLIVKIESRTIIQHARGADGTIATAIVTGGRLALDPPGIAIGLEEVFARV